jgi:hypothetical protein
MSTIMSRYGVNENVECCQLFYLCILITIFLCSVDIYLIINYIIYFIEWEWDFIVLDARAVVVLYVTDWCYVNNRGCLLLMYKNEYKVKQWYGLHQGNIVKFWRENWMKSRKSSAKIVC